MSGRLTEPQRSMLQAADEGGVLGFGPHRGVQDRLRLLGLLTMERGEDGYYHITGAGREALSAPPTTAKSENRGVA